MHQENLPSKTHLGKKHGVYDQVASMKLASIKSTQRRSIRIVSNTLSPQSSSSSSSPPIIISPSCFTAACPPSKWPLYRVTNHHLLGLEGQPHHWKTHAAIMQLGEWMAIDDDHDDDYDSDDGGECDWSGQGRPRKNRSQILRDNLLQIHWCACSLHK